MEPRHVGEWRLPCGALMSGLAGCRLKLSRFWSGAGDTAPVVQAPMSHSWSPPSPLDDSPPLQGPPFTECQLYQKLQEYAESCNGEQEDPAHDSSADSLLGDNHSDTLESSNVSSIISSPLADEVTAPFTPCEASLLNMEQIISDFELALNTHEAHALNDSAFEEDLDHTLVEELPEIKPEAVKLEVKQPEVKLSISNRKEEENGLGPEKVLLRSTSLKTGKTPPGTPHRKKIVRFADALGLDLEDVKHIASDEMPIIPSSAFSDLKLKDAETKKSLCPTFEFKVAALSSHWTTAPPAQRSLVAEFQQPASLYNFMERLRGLKVSLENVVVTELTAHCIIRVLNIGFEKLVTLRVTTNEWATFEDVPTTFLAGAGDCGVSDRFSANLLVPHVTPGQRVVFAVRYVVGGAEFWDSNEGRNYVLRCRQGTAVEPAPDTEETPWLHHFL